MTTVQIFDLQKVQRIRKIALAIGLVAVVGLAFFTRSSWGEGGLHEGLEALGLGLIVICIVGRAWCSLYIGGRKKAEIVDRGAPLERQVWNRDEAIALMDEATYDKYMKYLTGCADFFRRGITNIGQFTLVKG